MLFRARALGLIDRFGFREAGVVEGIGLSFLGGISGNENLDGQSFAD